MSSEVRKPSALVSLTATYSDSESDNESDNNSNDNNSNNESNQSTRDLNLNQNPTGSRLNPIGSRTNSPSNTFFSSIESLDKRKDLTNRSDSYNDEECLDIRPNSPISFHKSLFGKSEDQIVIPSEPIDRCSRSLQEKIFRLHEKMKMGYDMNTIIQKRKDFRNPSIYEKLIAYCGIDEMASNYPQDIYDPHNWGPESYYEELAKRQKEDLERRERERKEKTKVEFISGTKKGHNENSNDSISKKKSKWDLPNVNSNSNTNQSQINLMRPQIVIPVTVATGTKPTVISAFVNSEANARRIQNVENCFGISGVPLSIPGRVLVGEGILTKSCRKKLKPRQVFLFSDILVYGSVIINKKKYNRQHIIPLENVKLENLTDDNDLKYGWLIKTPNKSFAVYAATATEKVEWMAHINKCIEELLMRTGSRPASEHAAVWVPDSASPTCMACRKNFTVLNRRHHCRNCGVVVCGSCSKNRFLLPNQSSKPVRVCNACFETLGKSRTSFKENATDPQFGIKETTAIKPTILNESSESEDEDDRKNKQSDDDLTQSLEDLTIDEKPTFYSSINNTEVKRIGGQE